MSRYTTSQTGVGASPPIPLNRYLHGNLTVGVAVTGTVTYTVQISLDDVQAGPPVTWYNWVDAQFVNATANIIDALPFNPTFVRVNVTAGTGTAALTAVQGGLADN